MRQLFTPRKKRFASFLLIVPALLASAVILFNEKPAQAANPTTINFQGKVVNADGTNVSNGSYDFVFQLYNSSSTDPNSASCAAEATCLWEESQTSVTVTNGVFQVELGSVCPFFTNNACNENTPINFNTSNALYLTLEFNSDANGFMEPLMHFQSVPYAFNADRLGGLTSSGFIQNGTGLQSSSNFHISGTGVADTQLQSPLVDTATSNGTLGIGTTNAGVMTIGNVTNTTVIFNLKNSSTTALQVKNGSGNELLTVDTTNSQIELGKIGSSGINGSLVFNTTHASNTTITLVAASTATSYSLTLPTTGPSTSQCLKTNSGTASQLEFGSCGGGGGGTLATSYSSGTSQADSTITLDTTRDGVIIQDAASPIGGNLFTVQENGATALFFNITTSAISMQDSAGNDALVFDSTTSELKIYDNSTSPTNFASITATGTTATFKSNTGTTQIGNGTGAITINAGSGAAINITGHAASVWQTDAGSLTIQAGSSLSLLSTTSSSATFDSGSTGAVNIGTGANAKTITVGNLTSSTSLVLQGGSSGISLVSTGNIVIGTSNTTGTLLVLDTKTGAGDPSGVNGGLYYNSNDSKFRCYEGGAWKNCINSGGETDVVNSDQSSTSTTYANVTDLSFAVAANTKYELNCDLVFQTAVTTTGIKFSFNGPASPAYIAGQATIPTSLTAVVNRNFRAYDTATASTGVDTINSNMYAKLNGLFENGVNAGTIDVRFGSEVGGSSVTIKAGSKCTVTPY